MRGAASNSSLDPTLSSNVDMPPRACQRTPRSRATRFKPFTTWKANLEADETAREYRFYRFLTTRLKLFDEREFGGAVFVTAVVAPRARS